MSSKPIIALCALAFTGCKAVEIIEPAKTPGAPRENILRDCLKTSSVQVYPDYTPGSFGADLDGIAWTNRFPSAAAGTVISAPIREPFRGGVDHALPGNPFRTVYEHTLSVQGKCSGWLFGCVGDETKFVPNHFFVDPPQLRIALPSPQRPLATGVIAAGLTAAKAPSGPIQVTVAPNQNIALDYQPAGTPVQLTLYANNFSPFIIRGVTPGVLRLAIGSRLPRKRDRWRSLLV